MKSALFLVLLSLLIFSSACTTEYEHGTTLLCDTQRQVERYVALYDGREQSAINAVNMEEQYPTACVFEARDGEEQGKCVRDRAHSRSRNRDLVGIA